MIVRPNTYANRPTAPFTSQGYEFTPDRTPRELQPNQRLVAANCAGTWGRDIYATVVEVDRDDPEGYKTPRALAVALCIEFGYHALITDRHGNRQRWAFAEIDWLGRKRRVLVKCESGQVDYGTLHGEWAAEHGIPEELRGPTFEQQRAHMLWVEAKTQTEKLRAELAAAEAWERLAETHLQRLLLAESAA